MRATVDAAQVGLVHLAFLCVKAEAVEGAVRSVLPFLGDDSLLIAFQNGIAHHDLLQGLLKVWALGVTAQGATLLGPGVVRHGGSGPTYLGFLTDVDPLAKSRLQETVDLLNQAGIPTVISDDILAAAWNKLIVNAGINALTVLENCTNGELLSRPVALSILKAAVLEAAQVALAGGIKVASDPVGMTIDVCRKTAGNISSMLQDIRHGRGTEVEAINGVIVRQAAARGIPVPTNTMLWAEVKTVEGKAANGAQREISPGTANS